MRTPEEIKAETKKLKELRESLPEFNFFDDNNWERIDIQIEIINGQDRYENYRDADYDIESAAYKAKEWLGGNVDSLTD